MMRGAGGVSAASVFLAQSQNPHGGERLLLAPKLLHFADPGVGTKLGWGERLIAGLFDLVLHSQAVEQRTLVLLLAGGEFDQAANEIGSNCGRVAFHLLAGPANR
jgi:hypothetical protein